MQPADIERIVAIEQSWAPTPWSAQSFRNELSIPFSRALVAHAHGTPDVVAGYLVRWLVADEVHLLSIAVAEPMRRRGLGALMLDEVLREGRAESAGLVTLEVEAANETAVRLYKSRGFTEARCRKNYYGPGRHALVLNLEFACRVVS